MPICPIPNKTMLSRVHLLTATICLSLPLHTFASPPDALPSSVRQALNSAQIPVENTAIWVAPLPSAPNHNTGSKPIRQLAINAQTAMNPASVMKLVSTYTALGALGPAWRWKTRAFIEGSTPSTALETPLYIKGSGDPKFALEHLTALLRQIKSRGISQLNGGVVLDRSAFSLPAFNAAEFDNLPMRPYNVGPDALLINFHAITLTLESNESSVTARLENPADRLSVHNQIKPVRGSCDDWKDRLNPQIKPSNDGWQLTLSGSYAQSCGQKTLHLAPLAEDDYAAVLIRAVWQELGGQIKGQIRRGNTPTNAVVLAEQESPVLAEAVRDINKFSNNVMARQLFLSIAESTPATLEDARRRTQQWLNSQGLRFPELVIDNGSGLSRKERISADNLGKLLTHAWHSAVMPEFIASLPIIGQDGTMRRRLKDSNSQGRGHIKTGSLEGVKTMAGYVLDNSGQRYAVVFMINHPKASQGQAAMDALLSWIIEGK